MYTPSHFLLTNPSLKSFSSSSQFSSKTFPPASMQNFPSLRFHILKIALQANISLIINYHNSNSNDSSLNFKHHPPPPQFSLMMKMMKNTFLTLNWWDNLCLTITCLTTTITTTGVDCLLLLCTRCAWLTVGGDKFIADDRRSCGPILECLREIKKYCQE